MKYTIPSTLPQKGNKKRKHNAQQFGHLAMLYYPDRGYRAAVRLFREELRITGGLHKSLTALGYHDNQRILTSRQVRVIEDFIGEAG
jgi:hypothetical protein